MLDDKDLDKMLKAYRVPALDPDVVTQAMHSAVHRPAESTKQKSRIRFAVSPFSAFMSGGAVAIAAMILVILPLADMRTGPALNIDAEVNELAVSEQLAENDIKSTDEILGLIDSRKNNRSPSADKMPDDADDDAPIWDTFMGRS